MVAAVLVVLLILGALAAAKYSRSRLIRLDVSRLQQEAAARLLADSALELLAAQGGRGALGDWEQFETVGGRAGYLLGAAVSPPQGSSFRPALVFCRAGTTRKELYLNLIQDAPLIAGGPPVPGRTRLEQTQEITGLVANLPNSAPSPALREALLGAARVAAKKAAAQAAP